MEQPGPALGVTGAVHVAAGSANGCAVLGDGGAMCWGLNTYAQVGLGYATPWNDAGVTMGVLVPTRVPALSGVREIRIGETHACALLADDTVLCWGDNRAGQTGIGTTSPYVPTPTKVAW